MLVSWIFVNSDVCQIFICFQQAHFTWIKWRNEQIENHAYILKISGDLSFGVNVIVVTVFPCFSSQCFLFFIPRKQGCWELVKKVIKISMAPKIHSWTQSHLATKLAIIFFKMIVLTDFSLNKDSIRLLCILAWSSHKIIRSSHFLLVAIIIVIFFYVKHYLAANLVLGIIQKILQVLWMIRYQSRWNYQWIWAKHWQASTLPL